MSCTVAQVATAPAGNRNAGTPCQVPVMEIGRDEEGGSTPFLKIKGKNAVVRRPTSVGDGSEGS